MSDLADHVALQRASLTQFPVSWYLEQGVFEQELAHLFNKVPQYIGHELMVPNLGDFHTLEWMGHGKMLRHTAKGVELLSNICRHRQAVMLKGRGNAETIVCPLHRWTYDNQGKLLGAPHFPENPCLNLGASQLQNWNGLLFRGGELNIADILANLGVTKDLNFDGYVLDRVMIEEYNFNWKTFIEVYLEDYHVAPFHPGLGHFVTCDDLSWEFGEWYSVQTVGVHAGLQRPGSKVYQQWHESVLNYQGGEAPRFGAIWLTLYPNVMVECYPNVLVVSHVLPRGPNRCTNVVEFYYPEDIALFEREYVDAEQAAYHETAVEDEEICQRIDDGRKALYDQGLNEVGPYQSPMEDGMLHFHEWYRRNMGHLLKG